MTTYTHLLAAIETLDAVEADDRSVLDDDGVVALIELSDARGCIRDLIQAEADRARLLAALRAMLDDFGADYKGPTIDAARAALAAATQEA